jgi:hypothetical protein
MRTVLGQVLAGFQAFSLANHPRTEASRFGTASKNWKIQKKGSILH